MKATYGSGGAPIFFMPRQRAELLAEHAPRGLALHGHARLRDEGTVSFDDIVTRNTTFATGRSRRRGPRRQGLRPRRRAGRHHLRAATTATRTCRTPFSGLLPRQDGGGLGQRGAGRSSTCSTSTTTRRTASSSQCVQVPRMFWDPSYTDFTAAPTDAIDFGWSGQNNYFDTTLYPRQMIPRLLGQDRDGVYAGNATAAPGLSFSEYNRGCETRSRAASPRPTCSASSAAKGVFAATAWPLQTVTSNGALANYLVAAFDAYRNYDGKGSAVGDTDGERTTTRRRGHLGLRLRPLERRHGGRRRRINKASVATDGVDDHRARAVTRHGDRVTTSSDGSAAVVAATGPAP